MKKSMKRKIVFLIVSFVAAFGMFAQDDEFGIYSTIPNKITASSVLYEKGKSEDFYAEKNLCDSSWKSWVEGEDGDGINSEIVFHYDSPQNAELFMIRNGYGELRYYYQNNRVKELQVSVGQKSITYTLQDTYMPQYIKLDFQNFVEIKFKILSVYKGTKYSDTCISELRLLGDARGYNGLRYYPDDYTRAAMNKIDLLNKIGDPYERYKFIKHHSMNENIIDIVLLYPQNEKLLLILQDQKKIKGKNANDYKWEEHDIGYYEFDGENWVTSNDPIFDIIKKNKPKELHAWPRDTFPHKMDFYCSSDAGVKAFKITSAGFEQILEWTEPEGK